MTAPSAAVPTLSSREVREWIGAHLPREEFRDKRVLLIVPDATRTAHSRQALFRPSRRSYAPVSPTV